MAKGRAWDRSEILHAVELYCLTQFGRIHKRNPEIIALAQQLDRTPDSVALKMVNFAHLDPTIDRQGMSNVSKLDRKIWDEFFADSDAFFAQMALERQEYPEPKSAHEGYSGFREGGDYEYTAKGRTNQDYFRDMILATYDKKCCVTGIAEPELLIASHIVPWAADRKLRTDPRNGLCLNALHDKAFDRGLISFDEDYSLILAPKLRRFGHSIFNEYEGRKIAMPKRFLPSQKFLQRHRDTHSKRLS